MKKYEYDNATFYFTLPSEESMENIRKATERFVKRVVKEGIDISDWCSEGDKRTRRTTKEKRRRNTAL